MSRIIGIDLGTSTSEVAYLKEGKPFVIPNEKGECIIPSVVGILENGKRVVGREAKDQAALKPQDTVMEIKRLMGSKEKVKMENKQYSPEEISAFVISYLKEYAEDYLGEQISRAVITVPAYFTDQQRKATMQAGKIAGLQVERIINEPTAAALTYGIDHMDEEENILVYDLGGGTLDVTVLEMFEGVLEVKASSGNNSLGGKDFDQLLMAHLVKDFNDQNNIDLSKDIFAMAKIKKEAELCKEALSKENSYKVSIPFIAKKEGNPLALENNITKEAFENLIMDLIESTGKQIETALEDAKLKAEDIHMVLLVGGSTRIPLVHTFIEKILGQAPKTLLDPDLAVTMGAAIQGAMLNDELSSENDLMITDVCPYTLGLEVMDIVAGIPMVGMLDIIIPRNTTIPVSKEKIYTTAADGQAAAEIVIYQGDRKKAALNNFLGRFILKGIPPNPAGQEKIKVKFTYDSNGVLQVGGNIVSTGQTMDIIIDTLEVEIETEVDIDQWIEAPDARKFRIIIKKAEKTLDKTEEGWETEELENAIYELKKAIVLGATKEELDVLKEELEELLYDLEL